MNTYDSVVAEVADDLRIDEAVLRAKFSQFIQMNYDVRREEIAAGRWSELDEARCYAVYRLTKSAGAWEMAMKAVERRGARIKELEAGHVAGDSSRT